VSVEETFIQAAQAIVLRLTPQIIAAWKDPKKGAVTKRDGSIVTDTDHAVEREVVAHLAAALPQVAIVGEEAVSSRRDVDGIKAHDYYRECLEHEYCVFLDPIDGTKNFSNGDPIFCVAIGLTRRGAAGHKPVAGVVAVPVEDVMFLTDSSSNANSSAVIRQTISTGSSSRVVRIDEGATTVFANSTESGWLERSNRLLFGERVSHGSSVYDLLKTCLGENRAALIGSQRMWDLAAPLALGSALGLVLRDAQSGEDIAGLGASDFDTDLEKRAWRLSRRALLLPRGGRVEDVVSLSEKI
jgi:fructose-1,6-bisphosphatase/inositol monophosphatase family enzyme